MRSEPRQARSVASTERMLDAAEALLAAGGSDALTIDAVVRRSGVSNGALYARFGNRRGLLGAVQDRFLDRLAQGMGEQLARVEQQPELVDALRMLAEMFYDTFFEHRGAFNAFMLQTLPMDEFRQRGQAATRQAAEAIAAEIGARSDQIRHVDPTRAADFVFRTLFALGTQLAMFDDGEATGTTLGRGAWIDETTSMLTRYLVVPRGS